GPIVALSRSAPTRYQIAFLIELQHGRRGRATLRDRWLRCRVHLACFKRACPVDDPNVILSIHRNADSLAENPVIREGLRPQRIDFESRSINSRGFDRSSFLQDDTCNDKCAEQSHKDHTDVEITLHAFLLMD